MDQNIGILSKPFQCAAIGGISTYHDLSALSRRLDNIFLMDYGSIWEGVTTPNWKAFNHSHNFHWIFYTGLNESIVVSLDHGSDIFGSKASRFVVLLDDVSDARNTMRHGRSPNDNIALILDFPHRSSIDSIGMIIQWINIPSSFDFSKIFGWFEVDHRGPADPRRRIFSGQSSRAAAAPSFRVVALPSVADQIAISRQLEVIPAILQMTLFPLGRHRHIHQFVYAIRRNDPRNAISNGHAKPHSQSLGTVNIDGWGVAIAIGAHEAEETWETETVVAMAMCDENLGYFARFDAGSSLDGKLRRLSAIKQPSPTRRPPFLHERLLLRRHLPLLPFPESRPTAPPIQPHRRATHPPRHAGRATRRPDEDDVHIGRSRLAQDGMISMPNVSLSDIVGDFVIQGGNVAESFEIDVSVEQRRMVVVDVVVFAVGGDHGIVERRVYLENVEHYAIFGGEVVGFG
mmetsp:Transcript_16725/g.35031  ORF Transcript_16725/g.35031 Transcript_16725/m.35031 type:complete len:459 (-) Transcript_16725:120-1496(-)